MKVLVEVLDKEMGRTHTGTIEVPLGSSLLGPFELTDGIGNELPILVRSDLEAEIQFVLDYGGNRFSVEFWELRADERQTIPGGLGGKERIKVLPSWKFAKTPWRFSVTKLEN